MEGPVSLELSEWHIKYGISKQTEGKPVVYHSLDKHGVMTSKFDRFVSDNKTGNTKYDD